MYEPNKEPSEIFDETDRESEEMMHEWQCINDEDILWSKW